MPEGYLHLTCEQRCQIYALLQSGHSQAHIARQIGVDPSTSDFSILSDADVQRVEDKLNSRPRKILGYQTPREIFFSARNLPVALHC